MGAAGVVRHYLKVVLEVCGGLCEARCVDERSADWMKFEPSLIESRRVESSKEESALRSWAQPRSAQLRRDALSMQTRHPALMRVP